jgi:hypothetical protein
MARSSATRTFATYPETSARLWISPEMTKGFGSSDVCLLPYGKLTGF